MYTLSRDYARLFDLLCTGQVLVGWVRYSESLRDVVKIERRAEFDIYIGVRGICYTDLGTFDREKGEERDVFAARCESVDLEWIEPSVPRAEVAALRAQFHTQAEQRISLANWLIICLTLGLQRNLKSSKPKSPTRWLRCEKKWSRCSCRSATLNTRNMITVSAMRLTA